MSYSLIWLADTLKAAGLKVAECPGWKTCGVSEIGDIDGVICHHTATSNLSGNMPSLNTIIQGRPDLRGPLSQLGLGRDGTYYVIAAGKCNHAGAGNWNGVSAGNSHFIGIEAENTGNTNTEKWPDVQMDAYRRGVAAILKHIRKDAGACAGHKEYATPHGRKSDPNFDMDEFRHRVTEILNGNAPLPQLIPIREPDGVNGRPTLRREIANDPIYVKIVQQKIGVMADGYFGPKTESAVRTFQKSHDSVPDGIVGPKTWKIIDEK
jgi:peptidoglycan hydrolase-like protein with peptidoglycan-binding domain